MKQFFCFQSNPWSKAAAQIAVWLMLVLNGQTVFAQAEDLDPKLMAAINQSIAPAQPIDVQLAIDAGLSVYSGEHLILFSDLRDDEKARDLVLSYDAAVPQWCEYFGIDADRAIGWKLRAYWLQGPGKIERFRQARLIEQPLLEFAAGYQKDHNIYLYDQPGDYYTRHLLLHEGTHAFMQWFLDGPGAPWYSEGMSELLAVHQKTKDSVRLRYRLRDRSEAPYWGRVKIIKDELATGTAMTLDDVLAIPYDAFRNVRFYAWSWAACEFFDNHPLTREAFNQLKSSTTLPYPEFNGILKNQLQPVWPQLQNDWAVYIHEIDYGYDIEKGRITDAAASPDSPEKNLYSIAADRSWQRTKLSVNKSDQVEIQASGRYRVGKTVVQPAGLADGSKTRPEPSAQPTIYPWQCEAYGITLEYYQGQPLGRLQAGVLVDARTDSGQLSPVIVPVAVGGGTQTITIPSTGVLCFRINESPAKLGDNQGALDVRCKRLE